VTELSQPLAVRRYVAFAQAIYAKEIRIEEIQARFARNYEESVDALKDGAVPVMIDPDLRESADFQPHVIIDARMRKMPPEVAASLQTKTTPMIVGLGPGFTAGIGCHAVIETNRGPFLGRVIWEGQAQADTGIPERMGEYRAERVLRAPASGSVESLLEIGSLVKEGDMIARVMGEPVHAPFDGVLRGLVMSGLRVRAGDKIGDVDPRGDARLCWLISDKALSVGGGVLEAILSNQSLRQYL
jgi:xanthine dehydrogenase accessory factor